MVEHRGWVRTFAVVGALGVLLAGCGKDDSDGGPDGSRPGIAARLAMLPASVVGDGDRLVQVAIADLDRAVALGGISRPDDPTDPDQVREFVNALSGVFADGPPVATMLPETAQPLRSHQVAEFAAELGWTIADVAWFAEYQVPPRTFTAIGGLDHSRLADVLGERPDDGIWRLGGDDFKLDPTGMSAARPFGEALRMAVVDDHLVVSRGTPPVVAAQNGEATLADDPTLSALAAALDSEGAYSALLLSAEPSLLQAPFTSPQHRSENEDAVLPRPFRGVAVGSTQVDGAPYAVFAYAHDSEADATANADGLRTLLTEGASLLTGTPWSEVFEVADIRVDGTTVIARLTLVDRRLAVPYTLVHQKDGLVSHVGD